MANWKRHALVLISILICFPGVAVALQKGETLPELKGETLAGDNFELNSLKGEPILLKLGTTWCGTCRSQTKTIDGLRDFMAENGVHYVDIFIQESRKKVKKYFQKNGFQLPETVILDDGDISKKLNIYLIPRIILIDRDFKVYRDGDTVSEKNLKEKILAMTAKTSE